MTNNSMFKIIWLKAFVAFCIPFFTTLGASLAPYAIDGAKPPTRIAIVIVFAAVMVSGLSALSSFLSTTFAEHKQKQEAGVEDTAPAPQVVIPAAPQVQTVTPMVNKP